MSKTAFSDKCNIIGYLWISWKDVDDDNWQDFFRFADIGCPMAYMAMRDWVQVTDEGKELIEEVWEVLCDVLDIDPDDKYQILDDLFSASPNDVVEFSDKKDIMSIEKRNIADLQ